MNPLEEYISIIHTRQQNPLPKDEYKEEHHIIPQSLGGPDKKWNKVNLTPEEHYMAHYWLTFIYATGEAHDSMVYAWNWMSNRIRGEFISAEEYGRLKREHARILSESHKGIKLTKEHRRKLSESHTGLKMGPHSEEHRKKLSTAMKRRWEKNPNWRKPATISDERRKLCSERMKHIWAENPNWRKPRKSTKRKAI